MKFVLALVGAFLGVWAANIDEWVFALFAGAVIGWLTGMLVKLAARADALERKLAHLQSEATYARAGDVPRPAAEAPQEPVETGPELTPHGTPVMPVTPEQPPAPEAPPPGATIIIESREPSEPGVFERAFNAARDWLLSGNVPVKVGVIISFFGVAFLLKYAVEQGIFAFPIELRLAGVAAGAIAMLLIGWRVRGRNRVYALSIQGGGVGVLYLTVFAAFRLYQLLPPGAAFALLVALTAGTATLAVLQRAQALAVLGTAGGFLAPILVSTGAGNHVALFSYYLVLNLAVVGVAWFMAWRVLNIVGFAFTFVIGGMWGAKYYRLEHFASVEPFLLAYFAIYLAVAVLFAVRHGADKLSYVDGSLVFGLPIVAFAYQMQLVEPFAHARALSAVAAALVYGTLATWLLRRSEAGARLLCEAFLALAVGFGTIAIPLALDAQWTAAAWALEGAGLLWVGLRQKRLLAQIAGVALQLVAGVALIREYAELTSSPVLVNGRTLGGAMLAIAALYSGAVLERLAPEKSAGHEMTSIALVLLGAAWWYLTGVQELEAHAGRGAFPAMAIVFCAASAVALHHLAARFWAWRLNLAAAALPVLLLVAALAWIDAKSHPAQDFGWLAWPAALVAQLWLADRMQAWYARFAAIAAHVALWLGAALLAWETHWALRELAPRSVWPWVGAIAALALVGHTVARRSPGTRFELLGRWGAGVPLLAALIAALAFQLFSSGDPAPLPYVPLANPLDLATLAAACALVLWFREQAHTFTLPDEPDAIAWRGLATLGFVVVTMTTVRTFVHWAGVRHDLGAVMQSEGLQAALSIVWATLAVSAMLGGARYGKRVVWVAGAALMVAVVGKLLLIDLGNTGTVARIVSFIGVGVLLLVIGWFAPLPARTAEATR